MEPSAAFQGAEEGKPCRRWGHMAPNLLPWAEDAQPVLDHGSGVSGRSRCGRWVPPDCALRQEDGPEGSASLAQGGCHQREGGVELAEPRQLLPQGVLEKSPVLGDAPTHDHDRPDYHDGTANYDHNACMHGHWLQIWRSTQR